MISSVNGAGLSHTGQIQVVFLYEQEQMTYLYYHNAHPHTTNLHKLNILTVARPYIANGSTQCEGSGH